MKLHLDRSKVRISPDVKKVIPRFFNSGIDRSRILINRVMSLDEDVAAELLANVLHEFENRYRDIRSIFVKHFELIKYLLQPQEQQSLSETRKLLLGAYFTMEYSLEAAALFNPSIVEDPEILRAAAIVSHPDKNFSLIFRRRKHRYLHRWGHGTR